METSGARSGRWTLPMAGVLPVVRPTVFGSPLKHISGPIGRHSAVKIGNQSNPMVPSFPCNLTLGKSNTIVHETLCEIKFGQEIHAVFKAKCRIQEYRHNNSVSVRGNLNGQRTYRSLSYGRCRVLKWLAVFPRAAVSEPSGTPTARRSCAPNIEGGQLRRRVRRRSHE